MSDEQTGIGEKKGRLEGGAASDEAIASSTAVLGKNRGHGTIGLQQYFTPTAASTWIARAVQATEGGAFRAVLDLTAGDGSLLSGFVERARLGVEIDPDQIRAAKAAKRPYLGV